MKNVMLYAYTANNLGDDLFIKTICERYPDSEFQIYAPKIYQETFADLDNLTIIPSDGLLTKVTRQVLKPFKREYIPRETHAKKCAIGIYLGGSIFAEHDNWQADVRNVESMLHAHAQVYIIGANFGPSKTDKFINKYGYLFSKAHDVCFRDTESVEQFEYLPHVRQAADIVFNLQAKPNQETSNNIVISVIKPAARKELATYESAYITKLVEITEQLIKNEATVTLMSFCEIEKDGEICEEIYQNIDEKHRESVSVFHYNTNITAALDTIAQAKAVIATRFHAMILGWLFNKPTYPIIYSKKMKNVIEDILFPGKYVEMPHISEVDVTTVYNALQAGIFEIDEVKLSADRQFAVLDRMLTDQSPK